MAEAKKSKLTFEQALERLENIVSEMEEGEVPLEKSIDKYAEGIELIKQCRKILTTAEKKIQVLAKTERGELEPSGELEEPEEE